MKIIGLVGPKRSGKDTAAEYIEKKYGAKRHAHSEIFVQFLNLLGVENSRENVIKMVELRKVFGEDVLINAINKKIQDDSAELEVITGIRFQNEFENIRKYPGSILIYIDAPIEKRYKWQLEDNQYSGDSTMSFEEFVKIEKTKETEVHIAELGKKCEYKLLNNGSKEQLFSEIDKILKEHEIRA
ncbi:MAG: hypothetical protein AAB351_03040 [Patescibacteria group bacterium]